MNIDFKWYLPQIILWLVFIVALLNGNTTIQLVAAALVIILHVTELLNKILKSKTKNK